jgi:hypothetical protein
MKIRPMGGKLFHVMKLTVGFYSDANAPKMIGNDIFFYHTQKLHCNIPQINSRGHRTYR